MNEPVKSDVPAASPKSSPLTLPVPKSVATFSNCAEPDIVPVPFAIFAKVTEPPKSVELPAIVIELFAILAPST